MLIDARQQAAEPAFEGMSPLAVHMLLDRFVARYASIDSLPTGLAARHNPRRGLARR